MSRTFGEPVRTPEVGMDFKSLIDQLIPDPSAQIDTTDFLLALIISAIAGAVVSALYQKFYENRATGSQIHRSFLLMGPSITALFIAIQFSLPLSLGLLGALSIIRFRTPIKEPEEVGFIMLLIATAIICATFHFLLLLILLGLALVTLTVQKYIPRLFHSKRNDGVLLIAVDGDTTTATKERLLKVLDTKLVNGRLQSVAFSDNLTTIHYSFTSLNSNHLEGLQTSVKEIAPIQKMNIYFNRQGVLL